MKTISVTPTKFLTTSKGATIREIGIVRQLFEKMEQLNTAIQDPYKKNVLRNLHEAWGIVRKIVELEDAMNRGDTLREDFDADIAIQVHRARKLLERHDGL